MTDEMTGATTLPPALRRAVDLFKEPPERLDADRGYLDLLDAATEPAPPRNHGIIQAVWSSGPGSLFYDKAQGLARRFLSTWQTPLAWLQIPVGGQVLDVGCGPGNVTAAMARDVGAEGLALGVDISEPMLERAVAAHAGPTTGFLRADAQRLPFRDETFDAVTSLAVLQLVPVISFAVGEMFRVLRSGRRIAVMVPTVGPVPPLLRVLFSGTAHIFDDDELGDLFERQGFTRVRTSRVGNIQWVRAQRP
ncbi:methyltransferase domain protein [Mycolicibacterium hassiacum DSM 44199]|uniref:Methyltransferase domain protein n=2 Tax=Mycolicibacterium hassiacum TaxID=46351 RepID=K5BL25_MYCHD|nr:methyltransferase domain protein [Mycolicibacterium hassiacum DSM 44199]MDA4088333.1 SAM-dependent methyltransferase [Mycolicibacterium hassiacum DSM 44199]